MGRSWREKVENHPIVFAGVIAFAFFALGWKAYEQAHAEKIQKVEDDRAFLAFSMRSLSQARLLTLPLPDGEKVAPETLEGYGRWLEGGPVWDDIERDFGSGRTDRQRKEAEEAAEAFVWAILDESSRLEGQSFDEKVMALQQISRTPSGDLVDALKSTAQRLEKSEIYTPESGRD